jgi:hypothetical protein
MGTGPMGWPAFPDPTSSLRSGSCRFCSGATPEPSRGGSRPRARAPPASSQSAPPTRPHPPRRSPPRRNRVRHPTRRASPLLLAGLGRGETGRQETRTDSFPQHTRPTRTGGHQSPGSKPSAKNRPAQPRFPQRALSSCTTVGPNPEQRNQRRSFMTRRAGRPRRSGEPRSDRGDVTQPRDRSCLSARPRSASGRRIAGSGRREARRPFGPGRPAAPERLPPPHRIVRAVLPHTAHRHRSPPANARVDLTVPLMRWTPIWVVHS